MPDPDVQTGLRTAWMPWAILWSKQGSKGPHRGRVLFQATIHEGHIPYIEPLAPLLRFGGHRPPPWHPPQPPIEAEGAASPNETLPDALHGPESGGVWGFSLTHQSQKGLEAAVFTHSSAMGSGGRGQEEHARRAGRRSLGSVGRLATFTFAAWKRVASRESTAGDADARRRWEFPPCEKGVENQHGDGDGEREWLKRGPADKTGGVGRRG